VRRLLLILAAFAAQFAIFEVGMRVAGGSEAAPAFQRLFVPDDRIGHRLSPGASTHFATSEFASDIAINSQGVRGPEFPAAKPAGERRVAVLGDSLVLSVQVQQSETFVQLLEDRLNRVGGGPFTRVINGGVQGYGPVEELLFYRQVIAPLQPDVVLVMVFVANDAIEALDSAWRLDESVGALERAREDATGLSRRLVRRSMVLQTARLRINDVRDWLRPAQGPVLQRALTTYVPEPPPDVVRGLDLTRDTLGTLVREAGAHGARVGLVLVPARFQLNDQDFGHLQASARHAGQTLLRDAANERFADALRPLGVPMLDLLPVLRAQASPADLFFRENIHLTPRGHVVVGKALYRFVRESGLLGRE
jgi:lysophospholipase L1-like esterase